MAMLANIAVMILPERAYAVVAIWVVSSNLYLLYANLLTIGLDLWRNLILR